MNQKSIQRGTADKSFPVDIRGQAVNEHIIHLVGAESNVKHIRDSLESQHYQTQDFDSANDSLLAAKQEKPSAVFIDCTIFESEDFCLNFVKHYVSTGTKIILLTQKIGCEIAEQAYDAGVWRIVNIKDNSEQLNRLLLSLQAKKPNANGCVLYLCESKTNNKRYINALQRTNINVYTLNRLDTLLHYLESLNPDVLIVDGEVGYKSVANLLGMIRLNDAYSTMCIIVVANIYCPNIQQTIVTTEGNNFLLVPASDEDLVEAVVARKNHSQAISSVYNQIRIQSVNSRNQNFALNEHSIVSIADAAGFIIYVNDKFCEISGYSQNELIGQNHRIISSGVHPKSLFNEMWDSITHGRAWHGEICNRRKDGDLYWVEATIVPFLDHNGLPYQYVSIRTDITELKQTEAAFRQSEERLQVSQDFANIGTWDWNIVTNDLYWSRRIAPLFGYQEGELETTYDNFLNAVHPDDRQCVVDAVNACVEKGAKYDIEHRCVWPDGSVHWLREKGDVIRDKNGNPQNMLGVVQDITHRKTLEFALEQQKNLLNLSRQGMAIFMENLDIHATANTLLRGLLSNTNSRAGMLSEVTPNGQVIVRATYCSNEEKEIPKNVVDKFFAKYQAEVINQNLPITYKANGVDQDKNENILQSYVGIPAFNGDRLVGIISLANRIDAYDEVLIENLRPLCTTFSSIINANNMALEDARIRKALQQSKEEAEKASQAKSEFLSNVSHELRTPLNAILGFAQLFQYEDSLTQTQKENIKEIENAGDHLLALINEILDLAKIEAGHIEMKMDTVPLVDIVQECCCLTHALAESMNIEVKNNIVDNHLSLYADYKRVKQVLLNLLSNAVKYNRCGGSVTLSFEFTTQKSVRIKITDTGTGISKESQSELFQPFNRLDAATKGIDGTGIGLVISKSLINSMDGNIGVESKLNHGSTFWIELPIATGQNENQKIVNQPSDPIINQSKKHKHNILIVEDNVTNQKVLTQQLKLIGYQCEIAENGEQGFNLWQEKSYDAILTDIRMPVVDGLQMARMVRDSETNDRTPIIAVTASLLSNDKQKCFNAGMDDYLTKPLDLDLLSNTLHRWLKNKSTPVITRQKNEPKSSQPLPSIGTDQPISHIALTTTVGTNIEVQQYLVATFIKTTPEILQEISAAISAKTSDQVQQLAHKAKSSSRTIGALYFADLCQKIECSAKGNNWEKIEVLFEDLLNQMKILEDYAESHYQTGNTNIDSNLYGT